MEFTIFFHFLHFITRHNLVLLKLFKKNEKSKKSDFLLAFKLHFHRLTQMAKVVLKFKGGNFQIFSVAFEI